MLSELLKNLDQIGTVGRNLEMMKDCTRTSDNTDLIEEMAWARKYKEDSSNSSYRLWLNGWTLFEREILREQCWKHSFISYVLCKSVIAGGIANKLKATILLMRHCMQLLSLKFWQNITPLNGVTRIFPGVYFLSGHNVRSSLVSYLSSLCEDSWQTPNSHTDVAQLL